MGKTGLFDLETQFAFYGAYHSNPINIFIHVLFVWPIFFTALMYLYFTPSLYSIPKTLCGFEHGLVLNFGFLFTLIYAVSYVAFDKRAGSMAALLCLVCWGGASFLANSLGYSLTWKVISISPNIQVTIRFMFIYLSFSPMAPMSILCVGRFELRCTDLTIFLHSGFLLVGLKFIALGGFFTFYQYKLVIGIYGKRWKQLNLIYSG